MVVGGGGGGGGCIAFGSATPGGQQSGRQRCLPLSLFVTVDASIMALQSGKRLGDSGETLSDIELQGGACCKWGLNLKNSSCRLSGVRWDVGR